MIARPFTGVSGAYTRTENRRDYAVRARFRIRFWTHSSKRNLPVVGIGKIEDIFCHRGVSIVDHTKNNHTGTESTHPLP